jgi:hypothetical protein
MKLIWISNGNCVALPCGVVQETRQYLIVAFGQLVTYVTQIYKRWILAAGSSENCFVFP